MKRKIFAILSLVICLIIGFMVCPSESNASNILDDNISFNTIQKDIVIGEDKVLQVTETLGVSYKRSDINVGFTRNISRANTITREVNGKKYSNTTFASLTLESVTIDGEPDTGAFLTSDSEYYYINTGTDGVKMASGDYTYVLNYTYDLGEDFINAFDDFTFDILDYEYLNDIKSFSSTITFPSNLEELEGVSLEEGGSVSFHTNQTGLDIDYSYTQVAGKTELKIVASNINSRHGITIQVILPNHYFNTSYTPSILYYVMLAVFCISILAISLIFVGQHVKNKCIITPEFYPPENMSPIGVAKAYRGHIKPNDFASLIIYWASRGYVKLDLKEKNNVVITKLKDIDKHEKRSEQDYFNAIFKSSDVFSTHDNARYNPEISGAVTQINLENKPTKSNLPKFLIHLFAILPPLAMIGWSIQYLGFTFTPLLMLFPLIAIIIALYTQIPIGFKVVWCLIFGGVPLVLLILQYLVLRCYDPFGFIYIAFILFLLLNFVSPFAKDFSQDKELRGKILGFKNFLVTAEVAKLEMLVEENPQYFYNILPYCYVFGITKKIQEKFAKLKSSTWSTEVDTNILCASVLLHTMRPLNTPIRTTSSGGGRSFGGGGFGGSFGGGGGGGGAHGR